MMVRGSMVTSSSPACAALRRASMARRRVFWPRRTVPWTSAGTPVYCPRHVLETIPSSEVEPAAVVEQSSQSSTTLLRGSAWVLTGRVAAGMVGLGAGVLLARLLTATDLGDFYLAFSLASLAAIVARLGMDTPATRLVAEALAEGAPGRAGSVLRQTLVFTALGAGAVGAVSGAGGWRWLAVHGFGNHRLASLMAAATALIVCGALQGTLAAWFRGLQTMRLLVFFGELVPVGAFFVFLAASWLVPGRLGVAGALEMRAGGFALAAIGVTVAMRRRWGRLRGPGSVPRRQIAELGITTAGAALITAAVGSTSDLLILGAFRPSRDVAAYGIAVSLAALLSVPYLAMATALGPQLAELNARGERRQMEGLMRGAVSVVGIPTVAGSILLVTLARPILTAVFGVGYGRAAPVVMVLALAEAAFVLTGPCGLAMTMTGHHRPALLLTAMAAAASVGGDVWAAPRYGATGVAVASSVVIVLGNGLAVLLARRLVGVWTLPRLRRQDVRLVVEMVSDTARAGLVGWRRRAERGATL
jgi:O-antigen/teichoic acid export membrane protein